MAHLLVGVDARASVVTCGDTVDGSEIRRSPVDMVVHPIIYRVSYMSGGWEWDF